MISDSDGSFRPLVSDLEQTIVGLPFSLYSTFVIEERHGFNKQTLGIFFADKVKTAVRARAHSTPVQVLRGLVISRYCNPMPA